MMRWARWGAGVCVGLGWLALWARWFGDGQVEGPPFALLVEMALMALIYGVMGALFGLVAGVVWEVGRALVRYVGGGWREEEKPRS